jgi:hypothetical protein
MPPTPPVCSECKFFKKNGEPDPLGHCRCHSPPSSDFFPGHRLATWPLVDGTQEVCGEFVKK